MSETSVEVAVIGSGLAGVTAALRLSQRGYKVTLFEQDRYLGGQFRAVPVSGGKFIHEHCYHLFEGWYHNFWSLVRELGLENRFEGRHGVKYLQRGEFPKMTELKDIASWSSYLQNLRSGVLSIPDMYLFLYSYIDLLASPLHRDRYRDVISVNEFMHSRPYATERSTAMHSNVLLKAFGVPTFESAVQSYRKFVEFGANKPSPMFYVMKGNVRDNFWQMLENTLAKFGVKVHSNIQLKKIEVGNDGQVNFLHFLELSDLPTLVDAIYITKKELPPYPVKGSVVLAIPPVSLSNLITSDLYSRAQWWGRALKLRNEPMASVHLHFNERFVERLRRYNVMALPKEPVILVDSRFSITFLDNSHNWKEVRSPYLHVIASDYRELSRLDAEYATQHTYQGKKLKEVMDMRDLRLDMENPKSPLDHILAEVARYVPFSLDDLDLEILEIEFEHALPNLHQPNWQLGELSYYRDRFWKPVYGRGALSERHRCDYR